MAEQPRRRIVRRVVKPRSERPVAATPVSPVRRAAIIAGIVLVTVVAVVAFVKYAGRTGPITTVPGSAVNVIAPSGNTTEVIQDSRAAVLNSAVIIPQNPTSGTPLAVAYAASIPGGAPLEAIFRWFVDGTVVQDGPLSTLQPGPYRKGALVHAEVAIAGGTAATPVVTIGNGQPEVTMVNLGPDNAVVGMTLSATPAGTDPDGDPISYTYQWRVNGNLVGAPGNESTFSTADLKKRDRVSVLVTFTDGETVGRAVASNTIMLQNQAPKILSNPPLEVTSGLYSYQVIAKDPDGDPLTYRLNRFPVGMSIDGASGLIGWALPKGVLFTSRQEFAIAVTVSDGDGGSDSQDFTIVIFDLMVP
jgi:hypothetical protein